jgi:hypothetical protein
VRGGIETGFLTAQWLAIDQHRHPVVRIDREELRLELVTAADVAGDDFVRQVRFFQKDGDFLAVRGGPIVQVKCH